MWLVLCLFCNKDFNIPQSQASMSAQFYHISFTGMLLIVPMSHLTSFYDTIAGCSAHVPPKDFNVTP